jgi:hypothetical protein
MNQDDFLLQETGTSGLVIVFSSYGTEGNAGDTALAVPRLEFLGALKRHNLSCLLLKDSKQHWYHGGADGFAASIPELTERLSKFRSRYQHIVTLGHSMGGYAAILFAALCGFDAAIATAPQTFIDRPNRVRHNDTRWGPKIMELREIYPPTFHDLADAFRWIRPLTTSLNLFVGDDAVDRAHMEQLRSIPSTRRVVLPDCDHNSAKKLRDLGHLEALLSRVGAPEEFEACLSSVTTAIGNTKAS